MSATKRRLNFTGRRRIAREKVDVALLALKPNQPLLANVSLDLADSGFPRSAEVILEAYYRSSGQRFSLGRVGNLQFDNPLAITEVDLTGSILFRLQIVDLDSANGKVLGAAERLRPRSSDDAERKRSLLPIRETDLQDLVWKIDTTEAGPELLLNYRIAGFKQRLLESPLVQGMILPTALRIVLDELAAEPVSDEDDPEDWRAHWLQFVRNRLGIDEDPSELTSEGKVAWVESCLQAFCGSKKFIENIHRELEQE